SIDYPARSQACGFTRFGSHSHCEAVCGVVAGSVDLEDEVVLEVMQTPLPQALDPRRRLRDTSVLHKSPGRVGCPVTLAAPAPYKHADRVAGSRLSVTLNHSEYLFQRSAGCVVPLALDRLESGLTGQLIRHALYLRHWAAWAVGNMPGARMTRVFISYA